jgi:hypothetical protein
VTSQIVNLHQPVLLAGHTDMDHITDAFGKLRDNISELAASGPAGSAAPPRSDPR